MSYSKIHEEDLITSIDLKLDIISELRKDLHDLYSTGWIYSKQYNNINTQLDNITDKIWELSEEKLIKKIETIRKNNNISIQIIVNHSEEELMEIFDYIYKIKKSSKEQFEKWLINKSYYEEIQSMVEDYSKETIQRKTFNNIIHTLQDIEDLLSHDFGY